MKETVRLSFLILSFWALLLLLGSTYHALGVGATDMWLYDTLYVEPNETRVETGNSFYVSIAFGKGFEISDFDGHLSLEWNQTLLTYEGYEPLYPLQVSVGDGLIQIDCITIPTGTTPLARLHFTASTQGGSILHLSASCATLNGSVIAEPRRHVYNSNTGLNYTSIQEAIDANETLDGHTILVDAGTYYENVVVNKTVSLVGENPQSTIIDGGGIGNVVHIIVDGVNVTGFTVQNSSVPHAGIYLDHASNCSIKGNNITNNVDGIALYSFSRYNSISGSNITANKGCGIYLYSSSGNSISGNNITNNSDYGIYFYSSSNNRLFHNSFVTNGIQVYSIDSANIWDDGYPSGGNYWSDYSGADAFSGTYQNETGSDGIVDAPYIIDASNIDRYPLMRPWGLPIGDANGDGMVDIYDLILVAVAYGSTPVDPNWNPNADINGDGIIDIYDLILVASHYGETIP